MFGKILFALEGYQILYLCGEYNGIVVIYIYIYTFHSEYTKKTYKIFHNLNCHNKFLNYLGYCILCPKTQYVGKCESPCNIRLNNHRKDSSKPDCIPFDKHFQKQGHNFTKHARFILSQRPESRQEYY